ncbi:SAM-dependent methyltransferase [Streptomyces sp. MAR4 CNX-425]|uniref:SAM-dependent methyltransferase n=1 Tax=Streptomyces sp. MAR4 CNX-425 TaxID=3406343 RepID=UPI003B50900C
MADDVPVTDRALRDVIDTTVPHSARIWNYWLGGKDNYEVDRRAGDEYIRISPAVVDVARASRAFLVRSIRHLAGESGIRQFLDVGTGLPTAQNTHEVAQSVAPESRIVYVDHDPLVLAHARALLTSTPEGVTDYIDADMRDLETILAQAGKVLDLSRPTALILSGIMGHVADAEEARGIVRGLVDALPPGSYLSLNDGTSVVHAEVADAQDGYNETGAIPYTLRSPGEIAAFFDGLELVEPGVVSCPLWRPDSNQVGDPQEQDAFGGVGRKAA